MKKLACAVALACGVAFGTGGSAQAASVDVDVDITLPNFLVLYCYNDIDVDITAAALATVLGETDDSDVAVTGEQTVAPTAAGTTLTAALTDLTTDMGAIVTTAQLDITGACAVRGIAPDGTANASIGGTALTEFANGTSVISASNVDVTTATPAVTLGTPTQFGITMDLDLSGVTTPGVHDGDNAVTVVATAL